MPPDSAPLPSADQTGMADYYGALKRAHLAPLWESLKALSPAEPSPRAAPFAWPYAEARAHLMRAGELITAEKAERRVVVLANPGVPGGLQATDTLYAGLQLILPGEVAPTHRHSQSALRFVMEGKGAYTAVDGTRVEMSPGDFIITPANTWHEHGGGSGPVVWMDGLDVPLVGFLRAEFREEGGGGAPTGPEKTFAWTYSQACSALDAMKSAGGPDPCHGHVFRYLDPATGEDPMPTLGASLRLLPAGFEGEAYRSTDGVVLTVVEGEVEARIGGRDFRLRPRDIAAVPGWTPWRLGARDEAVVFAFSDRPAHQKLGLWRERRGAEAGEP